MQSSAKDLREFCQTIESDFNRKLFSKANSLTIIAMVGEALENHVNQILAIRKSWEIWLEEMGLPTRDDVADVACTLIKIENCLDCLDEDLYQTWEQVAQTRRQLAGLGIILKEMTEECCRINVR